MTITITVPRLDWSMEEGTFGGWLKQDGDQINSGDFLYVLESDKATQEIESLDGGVLRIPADGPKAGDTVKVGQVLAYLGGPEPINEQAPEVREKPPVAGKKPEPSSALSTTPARAPATSQSRTPVLISPRARRVARELGIDWHGLRGSGSHGRIRERDLAASGGGGGRLLPHTQVRRAIAAQMVASVCQAAPVTLTSRMRACALVNSRHQFRAVPRAGNDIVPSYTDLILKVAAMALRQHPLLQAQWRDDGLFVPDRIDIAMAVDTDAGLLVPVVRGVNDLTPRQIASQARELIIQARAGSLKPGQMRDATFTVTNLGSLGIDAFTPIIHLPQGAVLGVGRVAPEAVVIGEKIVIGDMVTLSLTFDHRVVDGAPAARFLDTIRRFLENPPLWLLP